MSHVTVPPGVLGVEEGLPSGLGTVVVAGEAVPVGVVARWGGVGGRRLVNAYGPTEVSVCAAMSGDLVGSGLVGGVVPMGGPMAKMGVYVLDGFLASGAAWCGG